MSKKHICEKDYIWNPSTRTCGNGCDELIEKIIPTNFNEKKTTCKMQNFYIVFAFLLITTTLLIAFSIYTYLIKYQAKKKHLLPFHDTNNELPFHDTNNELKQVLN